MVFISFLICFIFLLTKKNESNTKWNELVVLLKISFFSISQYARTTDDTKQQQKKSVNRFSIHYLKFFWFILFVSVSSLQHFVCNLFLIIKNKSKNSTSNEHQNIEITKWSSFILFFLMLLFFFTKGIITSSC